MRFRFVALLACLPFAAVAGEADVVEATARAAQDGTWTISATVRHGDTGWEHYADAFDITTPDGKVIATRILYHPHENEQPFTRSLTGVRVPKGVSEIIVRARDKTHGYGGKTFTIKLER